MRLSRSAKAGIAVVLAMAVGYGSLKAYIYFQVRDALKQFIALVSPFASVQYRGIGSNLYRGAAHVTRLRITPNGMSDVVTVDRLTLESGSLWALLSMSRRLDAREFPGSLGIAVQGLTIGLEGELVQRVEALARKRDPSAAAGPAHCAGLSILGPAHLRKLGYPSLVSDLHLRIRHDRSSAELRWDVEGSTRDLSSGSVAMTMKGPIGIPRPGAARAAPTVTELMVVYQDAGYTERLKNYCAQASGTSVEDYIKAEVSQPPEAFQAQWGFVPGPGLREAYRAFLTTPGELSVRIAPSADFSVASAHLAKPDELLAQLNATVKVNGQRVDDLSFTILEPAPVAAQAPTAGADTQAADAGQPAASQSETGPRPRARRAYEDVPTASARDRTYQIISVDELAKSVGEQVRLTVGGNRVREGALTRVLNNVAYVEVRLAGTSTVVVQIPFTNIQKAEVLR